jgi:hypothetical protein
MAGSDYSAAAPLSDTLAMVVAESVDRICLNLASG